MQWSETYLSDRQPTAQQISEFIHNPLWEEINAYLSESYETEPSYSYSLCSGQPGWNVKYKKAGRSLCTLYPMDGFFIVLVTIGNKEQAETERMLPGFSAYIQTLYAQVPFSAGGRWLMIHVTDQRILEDVKSLIAIRRKVKKTA